MPQLDLTGKLFYSNGDRVKGIGYVTAETSDKEANIKALQELLDKDLITITIEGYMDNAHHEIKYGDKKYCLDCSNERKFTFNKLTVEDVIAEIQAAEAAKQAEKEKPKEDQATE